MPQPHHTAARDATPIRQAVIDALGADPTADMSDPKPFEPFAEDLCAVYYGQHAAATLFSDADPAASQMPPPDVT